VLGFLESTEVEDSFLMVTEHAVPIGMWLKTVTGESDANDLEVIWGLKCVFEALHFLHSKCFIAHCNINTLSCFYTKNGDWKLGLFDLACKFSKCCIFACTFFVFIPGC
jgi:SCY1-like protein 1